MIQRLAGASREKNVAAAATKSAGIIDILQSNL
jgi:hypothetical protein